MTPFSKLAQLKTLVVNPKVIIFSVAVVVGAVIAKSVLKEIDTADTHVDSDSVEFIND